MIPAPANRSPAPMPTDGTAPRHRGSTGHKKSVGPTRHRGAASKRYTLAKKKRKRKKKHSAASFSSPLVPKGKILARSTALKLDEEIDNFAIARGAEFLHRLDPDDEYIDVDSPPTPPEAMKQRRLTKVQGGLIKRTNKRKTLAIRKYREELKRKRYRVNPSDKSHKYKEGYHRQRHRITKDRFMKCVDQDLFDEVMRANQDLVTSPLWSKELKYSDLTLERAELLKTHMYQFEVIVECLKDGLFDKPGCNDFPVNKVRRRKKQEKKADTKKDMDPFWDKMSVPTSQSEQGEKKKLKYPPYIESDENENPLCEPPPMEDNSRKKSKKSIQIQPSRSNTAIDKVEKPPCLTVSKVARWLYSKIPNNVPVQSEKKEEEEEVPAENPYGDFMAIDIPESGFAQKEFITLIANHKIGHRGKQLLPSKKKDEEAARKRHALAEKMNPLQRLHPDELDSDIESRRSTSTDGYASWRQPKVLKGGGTKAAALLAHKVDSSLAWRIVLFLIVMYEILQFFKARIDDVYYGIFTSHLNRENVWLEEPGLYATDESGLFAIVDWIHFILSILSTSIIHRENEPVSLLFAISLLIHNMLELARSFHDYIYLQPIGWPAITLTILQCIFNACVISLFIGYHYYTAGYIRKSRETHHRLSKLHNHEIRAKSVKGIQRRRLAFRWMQRHARDTNLRRFRKVYPKIKDGNYPLDDIKDEIKFREQKEMWIYAQRHNLHTGYPYNKIQDMKKYVYGPLEHSDYTERDERKEIRQKIKDSLDQMDTKMITTQKCEKWMEDQVLKASYAPPLQRTESKKFGRMTQRKPSIIATDEQKQVLNELKEDLIRSGKLKRHID